jgi:predicted transposase YbfD/YdcC
MSLEIFYLFGISASLCGCEDIHLFAEERQDWLQEYIHLKNVVPSPDTIARVFSVIDPSQFEVAFRSWVSSLYQVKGGKVIISLKGNQGILHDDVRLFLESEKKNDFKNTPHSYFEAVEKGHSRVETRRYWITDSISWLDRKKDWKHLTSIGLVESSRCIKGKISAETRCFIASIKLNANKFAQVVRQHFRMRVKNAAQNLSIMRRMVPNILKLDDLKGSLKGKRKKAGWSKSYFDKLSGLLFKF